MFAVVFALGVVLGGGARYSLVQAQLAEVETTNVVTPSSGQNLGNGGGSCG